MVEVSGKNEVGNANQLLYLIPLGKLFWERDFISPFIQIFIQIRSRNHGD